MANLKTLGPKTAVLVTQLYERGQTVFDLSQAADILGVDHATASSLVRRAARRGVFTQVRRGLFNLVPFELGQVSSHLDDRYLLVDALLSKVPHFLSHASAMDLHRLSTQPNFDVYASTTRRLRDRIVGGNPVHFVTVKEAHFFGVARYDLANRRVVAVSDLERTLLDGVRQPEYCGGMTEVAKAFFMAKGRFEATRMAEYAERLGVRAVKRRAGFLLEFFQLAPKAVLDEMRASLPAGVAKLDPSSEAEGPYRMDWGLRLNLSPESLRAVVGA